MVDCAPLSTKASTASLLTDIRTYSMSTATKVCADSVRNFHQAGALRSSNTSSAFSCVVFDHVSTGTMAHRS